ncbi:MAG TPA: hypothetical protein VN954_00835 [Ktedonobacteraceae bacterium]|nr:hypothetical protein [Ktedonobacteraceae bacterium]
MTNTFKRRIFRWCVVSAASFLAAFLLYDLQDVGIDTELLIFPCAMLWMGGILLGFKALEIWSGWLEDASEDSNMGLNGSNLYPITFYLEATLGILIVVFLLVFTIIRNRPTIAESTVLFVALVLAGACTGMGLISRRLE